MTTNDQTRAAINEGLRALITISGENSRDHGFHEDFPGADGNSSYDEGELALSITQKLMLINEELTESFGEIRDGRGTHEIYYVDKKGLIGPAGREYPRQAYGKLVNGEVAAFIFGEARGDKDLPLLKPEGFLVEIADLFIRGADLVYLLHGRQTFLSALAIKHEYNATRPYKHGRKF